MHASVSQNQTGSKQHRPQTRHRTESMNRTHDNPNPRTPHPARDAPAPATPLRGKQSWQQNERKLQPQHVDLTQRGQPKCPETIAPPTPQPTGAQPETRYLKTTQNYPKLPKTTQNYPKQPATRRIEEQPQWLSMHGNCQSGEDRLPHMARHQRRFR